MVKGRALDRTAAALPGEASENAGCPATLRRRVNHLLAELHCRAGLVAPRPPGGAPVDAVGPLILRDDAQGSGATGPVDGCLVTRSTSRVDGLASLNRSTRPT